MIALMNTGPPCSPFHLHILRVALVVERTVASTNRAKAGRAGIKRRELEKDLPKEKVDKLCNRLRSLGLWQYDEDWPEDEEDPPN